ncbi:RNA polymerase ECF-type sigma factor [Mariniradius saccharolyticus AK6]|uniref:RNA polymerase ECF-type sigma factor n=1 Tax=Mariniradius saccharolyticus AK6 TaxID=1239962 RepID=M7X1K3_9BACT|nr:RNA polymerase ECF-type sigma factor [Mariniradius saccharolyticus AK6]
MKADDAPTALEKALIQKAKDGDKKSIELLYKQFYGFAMSVALRYSNSRDEACEIVNDSFMKAFDRIKQYQTENSFKGWFRRIIVNTSIDYYRKNSRYASIMDIDKAESESYSPDIIDQLTFEDILGLIRSLPEILRIVFNLYEIEGYDHNEIGEKLGIPASTSRTYLARSKKKLREKVLEINHIRDEGAIR